MSVCPFKVMSPYLWAHNLITRMFWILLACVFPACISRIFLFCPCIMLVGEMAGMICPCQVTKKSNYSVQEYSAKTTHPIFWFAVESYSKAAFIVRCCTHEQTVESKKIQHCKTAPSSMFCCLFSMAHGFACCRYCSKKAFCCCIQVVIVAVTWTIRATEGVRAYP